MRRDAIPRDADSLRRYLVTSGYLHVHIRTVNHKTRWQLAHRVTRLCYTEACMRVPLTRGRPA